MGITRDSRYVRYQDEKLLMIWDCQQGGTLVDFRWLRMAPGYNVCAAKGGAWLNTSHEGISDGTNKGAYQGTEKNPIVSHNGRDRLNFRGELHFGDRLTEQGPFKYELDFAFGGGWIDQRITFTVTAAGAGKRFYAINQAMDFDQSFNKAIVPARSLWVGRSEDWRCVDLGEDPYNEVETIQELGAVSTLYKIFGNMRTKPAGPSWGGLMNGHFGLIVLAPDNPERISIGWNAGYNWALDPGWRGETVGNSFVRSIETAHMIGDGNRRFLEARDPNAGVDFCPPNPALVEGQVVSWRACWFPFEGPDWRGALGWIRASGFDI